MEEYRVDLEIYNGPLDLLLYLIRREEIDIQDIPVLRITTQFVAYVELLKHIDPEAIGDFLVMAATLMEIKSRALLPTPPPEEDEGEFVDPRVELVRQLLEYKAFKDAARSMELAAKIQALRHPRDPVLPEPPADEIDIDDVEVWDLLDAFNKLLEQTGQRERKHTVEFDDTPLLIHIDDVLDTLEKANGAVKFTTVFEGRSRSTMIGLFLALLELIRQRRIRATQDAPFGDIILILLDPTPVDDVSDAYASNADSNVTSPPAFSPEGSESDGIDQGPDGDTGVDAGRLDEVSLDTEDSGTAAADDLRPHPAWAGPAVTRPATDIDPDNVDRASETLSTEDSDAATGRAERGEAP